MSNLIEQFFISNNLQGRSAKVVSFKESMEWKNIFDKAMLDVFDQNNGNKSPASNNQGEKAVYRDDSSNTIHNNLAKGSAQTNNHAATTNNNQISTGKSQSPVVATTVSAAEKTVANQAFFGINSVDKEAVLSKMISEGASKKSSFNRSALNIYNQSIGRIHLSKSGSGVKIFVRNNHLDEKDVIKLLQDVAKRINHSGITIHEIKLNGQTIKI